MFNRKDGNRKCRDNGSPRMSIETIGSQLLLKSEVINVGNAKD